MNRTCIHISKITVFFSYQTETMTQNKKRLKIEEHFLYKEN